MAAPFWSSGCFIRGGVIGQAVHGTDLKVGIAPGAKSRRAKNFAICFVVRQINHHHAQGRDEFFRPDK